MTVHQRKRGIPAKVWKVAEQEDDRGNTHRRAVPANPHDVSVWIFPQRSSKAEVPGQQSINIVRIGTPILPDVELWSRVEFLGAEYDVVTPPAYHHGTRHTRHYSMDLRERPS